MIEPDGVEFTRRFDGQGARHDILCLECAQLPPAQLELYRICQRCWRHIGLEHEWDHNQGHPARRILEERELTATPLFRVAPLPEQARGYRFADATQRENSPTHTIAYAVSEELELWLATPESEAPAVLIPWRAHADFSRELQQRFAPDPEQQSDPNRHIALHLSPSGRFLFITQSLGCEALLLDLWEERLVRPITRGDYHPEHCPFPAIFTLFEGEERLVCGTEWNRLDIFQAESGALLTEREFDPDGARESTPPSSLDYFHCTLHCSRDHQFIADTGWVWHPIGVLTFWSLERWQRENLYESERGESNHSPRELTSFDWDKPMTFLDDARFVVRGIIQEFDENDRPGLTVVDARSGELLGAVGMDQDDAVELGWSGEHVVVLHGGNDATQPTLSLVDVERDGTVARLFEVDVVEHVEALDVVVRSPDALTLTRYTLGAPRGGE